MLVILVPCGDMYLGLMQHREPVVVEDFAAEAAVEALDASILRGFAGLDEGQPAPIPICASIERQSGQVWVLIRPFCGLFVSMADPVEQCFGEWLADNLHTQWHAVGAETYGH